MTGTKKFSSKSSYKSDVKGWKLCPANIHSNSVFQIRREWRSLSKAGAVNFMYHLWNCHRGHVLCSILLQKQVRPFLSSATRLLLSESTLSFFNFTICVTGRGILCEWVHQTSPNDLESLTDCGEYMQHVHTCVYVCVVSLWYT